MKFKIDQNLPIEAADLLAAAGHDAMTVCEQLLGGAPDEQPDAGPIDPFPRPDCVRLLSLRSARRAGR